MSSSTVDRAMKMINDNMFLTLATAEDGLPWCSTVAYVKGPGSSLHFYSATEAAHSRHIGKNPAVAMALWDSRARGDDVDGLQLEARCTVVEPPDLEPVVEHYFDTLFPDPEDHAWWYRPSSQFTDGGIWRFYALEIEAAFVIDQENFAKTKIDRHVRVDLKELLDAIADAA